MFFKTKTGFFHPPGPGIRIRSNHFLEYQQLISSIQAAYNIRTINLNLPSSSSSKRLLPKIYNIILVSDKTLAITTIKRENDLLFAPDTEFWNQITHNIYLKLTKYANLQLIQ